jgi:hypothetical protein
MDIVVAVIRRIVTYKKHRADSNGDFVLIYQVFTGHEDSKGAGESTSVLRCSYTKQRAKCLDTRVSQAQF